MLLKVEDLHVYYGAIHALKGIHLKVQEGEIVTLVGANGAGKSTTLLTIAGLLKPQKGAIYYQGRDITGLPAPFLVKEGIALVPEGRRVFSRLTVRENLELGAYLVKDKGGDFCPYGGGF